MACDEGNLVIAQTAMANGMGAASDRRISGFDQIGINAAASWTIYTQTPSVNAAMGQRIATESGSGMTRREVNETP